jgi:acetyltransferase-like isoleucine patch superfamily enzyme
MERKTTYEVINHLKKPNMISKMANVRTDQIGQNVVIKENVIIRENVIIGNDVIIHPNVIIEEGCEIGDGTEIFPGTYIGKIPKGAGATARPISFAKTLSIGRECSIGPNAVLFYEVSVGNNTLIGDGASLREKVRVGDFCIISRYVTINYNTQIGNNTKIMDLTHITGNCIVGNNVFISIHVSTVNDNVVVNREYDETKIIGPRFLDNCTIGAGAIILPGVTVSQGSMVGSGSVVTKDIPENVLALGIPAKIVRQLK